VSDRYGSDGLSRNPNARKRWTEQPAEKGRVVECATTGFVGALFKFLGVFALTQIPLSIAEGVLGVLLFGFFTRVAPAELARLGVITKEAAHV